MHMYSPWFFAVTIVCFFAHGSALNIRNVAYYDPTTGGGSMLDDAGDGYGEPLNVIISGLSSPEVLTDDGIINYARAIGFSTECLGMHLGDPQSANLGDGNGNVKQTFEVRQDYGNSNTGTCLESLIGGNHFRVYRQNGPWANSGALFLAYVPELVTTLVDCSVITTTGFLKKSPELTTTGSSQMDMILEGVSSEFVIYTVLSPLRNELVSRAIGQTSYAEVTYSTMAQNVTGLLAPGSVGVNHGVSQDGIVAVLTVTIV